MRPVEKWIWLPESAYPQLQTTHYSILVKEKNLKHYAVVSFTRSYEFGKGIQSVDLRFSGDTAFSLHCNDRHIANGPPQPGGDFLEEYHNSPLPQFYATRLKLTNGEIPGFEDGVLHFRAQVRMMPIRCFDFSRGHGGFFLTAEIRFADGTKTTVFTDESWKARLLSEYTTPGHFDNSLPQESEIQAGTVINIWNCQDAPIPPCVHTPIPAGYITLAPGETITRILPLDMIYAGYLRVRAKTQGKLKVTVLCRELEEAGTKEELTFIRDGDYQGLELHSAGNLLVTAENRSDAEARLDITFLTSHYPAETCAVTTTSDNELNQVLATCVHTLKYCRQSIHLDSPRHCEPLACTGDYYIEALMTAFSFGDQRLSVFDVRRTAELLRHRDGRMFHTSYSLIWVQMLMDVYWLTGERELLADCEDALTVLLNRFHTYLGSNHILETPPDYMFIDWLIPDGISLHHPPKALGQTCLNLYYYGALKTAAGIYRILGEEAMAQQCMERMDNLHYSILANLYDPRRSLFFEGLNTPTPEYLIGEYMPRNVEKRYYRKHANILAAYFGFFPREDCALLLERILSDDSMGQVQPYFCHFLLEAVYRNGLRDNYTLHLLEQWKAPVRECNKGLAEGFYKPEPTYSFDHSHAWGGTPAYALPLALSGLEILEPGMGKIRLNPSLMGLKSAHVQIPTPYGMVEIHMEADKDPQITLPEGVHLIP